MFKDFLIFWRYFKDFFMLFQKYFRDFFILKVFKDLFMIFEKCLRYFIFWRFLIFFYDFIGILEILFF